MKFGSKTLATLAIGALALGGCGNVADSPEMLEKFAEECKSGFVSEGGPAEMADGFCDCSIEKVKEQELGMTDLFDQEKMKAIGLECAEELLASGENAAAE